jgi:hypothetical protein
LARLGRDCTYGQQAYVTHPGVQQLARGGEIWFAERFDADGRGRGRNWWKCDGVLSDNDKMNHCGLPRPQAFQKKRLTNQCKLLADEKN